MSHHPKPIPNANKPMTTITLAAAFISAASMITAKTPSDAAIVISAFGMSRLLCDWLALVQPQLIKRLAEIVANLACLVEVNSALTVHP